VPLARRFCPRVVGLFEGEIVADGPASEVNDELLRTIYGDEAVSGGATEAEGATRLGS